MAAMFGAAVIMSQVPGVVSSAVGEQISSLGWKAPTEMVGNCWTVFTNSPTGYEYPYLVQFDSGGHFRWWAKKRFEPAAEIGKGTYLEPPTRIDREDGSWEAHYFSANRFTPDPAAETLCTCEYVGQPEGPGKPFVLADYFIARVPNSTGFPVEEVCAPHRQECPKDNATATEKFGNPFIEIYSTCASPLAWPEILQSAIFLLIAVCSIVYGCHKAFKAYTKRSSEVEAVVEPYLSLPGDAETAKEFKWQRKRSTASLSTSFGNGSDDDFEDGDRDSPWAAIYRSESGRLGRSWSRSSSGTPCPSPWTGPERLSSVSFSLGA